MKLAMATPKVDEEEPDNVVPVGRGMSIATSPV
jgi:hypothetical protein